MSETRIVSVADVAERTAWTGGAGRPESVREDAREKPGSNAEVPARESRPVVSSGPGASRPDLLDAMVDLRARRQPYAIATVVETVGSASAAAGAKALIDRNGRMIVGWVGGGCAESMTRRTAIDAIGDGEPRMIDLDMNDEVLGTGMPCGGSMRVFVEPVLPQPILWILGHGRIAECLSRFGATLGFGVIINDDPEIDPAAYPDAAEIITDDLDYSRLVPGPSDCVVIATQHKGDHLSAVRALRSPAAYIAIIASRKRSKLVLDFLREEGFPDEELGRVHAPAGLDLGAKTPEEIALSVLSEIVMLRRGADGRPRRAKRDGADARPREPAEASP